jgi:hypothetical protein
LNRKRKEMVMAGSYWMLIDHAGQFSMDMIENLGDAYEALEECVGIIRILSEGSEQRVLDAIKKYKEGRSFVPTER